MTLSSKSFELTTSNQELLVAAVGSEGSVHGLVFGNTGSQTEIVTVQLFKSNTGLTRDIGAVELTPNAPWPWPKPINLEAGDKLYARCSSNSVVDAALSYYSTTDIDVSVAVGFTPMGAYNSGATYKINDVAYSTDADPTKTGSYVSRINGNIGNTPASNPTQWMMLTQRGVTPTSVNELSDYASDQLARANEARDEAIAFAVAL